MVLDAGYRLLINIEQAEAGIDYPTDGPADLHRGSVVWTFSDNNRVPVPSMYAIEKAVAGIDYPTDGPADRDFYVAVTFSGDDLVRTRIQ